MKKIGLLIVLLSLIFSTSIGSAFANSNGEAISEKKSTIKLTDSEIERLIGLGFSEENIADFSIEEYSHIKYQYEGLVGKLEKKDVSYIEVSYDHKTGTSKSKKINKEEYDKKVKEEKDKNVKEEEAKESKKSNLKDSVASLFKSPRAHAATSNSTSVGYLTQTTVLTRLYNSYGQPTGNYKAQNSFKWSKRPSWTREDTIAITHPSNVSKVVGSQFFSYTYTDGLGDHTTRQYTGDPEGSGISFKFDLATIGNNVSPYNHRGYMYYNFYKGSSSREAQLFGHYVHTEAAGYTVSLGYGSISVTVDPNDYTKAPNTWVNIAW
ncbi:hypothetical protein [Sutcliffiella horikoshii]|uniref:hypothetical protein n=1 Tax=Sutcliffiella horikoshii TaxID=79883 RepID=UPI00384D8B3E